jgi:hypothetical protein
MTAAWTVIPTEECQELLEGEGVPRHKIREYTCCGSPECFNRMVYARTHEALFVVPAMTPDAKIRCYHAHTLLDLHHLILDLAVDSDARLVHAFYREFATGSN